MRRNLIFATLFGVTGCLPPWPTVGDSVVEVLSLSCSTRVRAVLQHGDGSVEDVGAAIEAGTSDAPALMTLVDGDALTLCKSLLDAVNLQIATTGEVTVEGPGSGQLALVGAGEGSLVTATGSGTLTIRGLSLQGGQSSTVAGGLQSNGVSVVGSDLVFRNNSGLSSGMNVMDAAGLDLSDCSFVSNVGDFGGLSTSRTPITLQNVEFANNNGIGGSGGVTMDQGSLTAIGLSIHDTRNNDNWSCAMLLSGVTVDLSDSSLIDNGCGISINNGTTMTVTNTDFSGNNQTNDSPGDPVDVDSRDAGVQYEYGLGASFTCDALGVCTP